MEFGAEQRIVAAMTPVASPTLERLPDQPGIREFAATCLAVGAGLALGCLSAAAQEAAGEKKAPKPQAQVTKIGEHRYRLGEITFDAKSREIRLPVLMNMREGGPIEYLLVHENGAVHEALLTTKVRGLNLQVVLKLLRYEAGEGDLFDAFLPEEERRQKIESAKETERGDALDLVVSWERGDEHHEHPVADWILDAETSGSMTDEPWILTGSHFYNGHFLADTEGSLVGIYLDQSALFNMSRKGAVNDERWGANAERTPEIGQKITLILRPAKKD